MQPVRSPAPRPGQGTNSSVAPVTPLDAINRAAESICANSEGIRRSLPDVATEVIQLCQSLKSDAAAIEKVVSRDPFISAQLISLANSAMFAPRTPIVGIRDAVVRIGLDAVRDLVMLVVTNSTMFRLPGFDQHMEMLRKRSMATAMAARILAKTLHVQAEYAFLAGLLHDIGLLLILEKAVTDGGISAKVMSDPKTASEVFARIEHHHQEAGAAVCRAWKLPQGVIDSAAYHHNYRIGDKHYMAANLVAVTDLMVDHLGIGAPQQTIDFDRDALKDLRLTPDKLNPCLLELEKLVGAFAPGKTAAKT